jgi:6-pyruvoyltetrahydropterin/6-carboxytetrahydropterin synthase
MTTLTRRYSFSASHRLHSPFLSPDQNARIYGKCNHPFGHGHNYLLEVTVAGSVDASTGLLVPAAHLDRLVEEKVLSVFAFCDMNAQIPQFVTLPPTTENVACVIAQTLQQSWPLYIMPADAWLHRIRIEETGRNAVELHLERPSPTP